MTTKFSTLDLLRFAPTVVRLVNSLRSADGWAERFLSIEPAIREVAPITATEWDDTIVRYVFDSPLRGVILAALESLDGDKVPSASQLKVVLQSKGVDNPDAMATALETLLEVASGIMESSK